MQHLKPNTTLQGGKYKIERIWGQIKTYLNKKSQIYC